MHIHASVFARSTATPRQRIAAEHALGGPSDRWRRIVRQRDCTLASFGWRLQNSHAGLNGLMAFAQCFIAADWMR